MQVRHRARVVALAMVMLVGAGGCASVPQADPGGTGGGLAPVGSAEQVTGAGASSLPDQLTGSDTKPRHREKPQPKIRATTTPKASTGRRPRVPQKSNLTRCQQGEHQREVETYLARLGGFGTVTVDGRQTDADCAAIKKFQQRYDIRPAEGRAGPLTYDVAKRLATTDVKRCSAGSGTTFCVDLTRQTTWVMRDGKVVAKPTVTRTGMAGYATPAGTYRVNFRNLKEWSNPYEVWLPYWQRFNGGIGFHQTTTYLHNAGIGSHGCVNLLHADAVRWWELGRVGSRVVLVGRRPGT
ncbi:L,D-transpeptidase family protein [Micromonospora sp. HUAS LYJ1]|uniref:L,D-transpeptidase family protein n=1 Tax=Micromonospora sp. HUAS LYJ1 TaxID=3061626 RepID=UPI002671DC89|nr:L,D-transpeptidase family protein [Micromonospora sp. HUAS LYJ1]WKU03821.1 L,D-transpeptidase family protein [Micromonospora sp. HUAS LYJ1]